MSFEVDVQYASRSPGVPAECELQAWATAVLARHCSEAALSLRMVDEAEGAALNTQFRGGDSATNVLSFAFEAPELTQPALLGDVVICTAVVEREARLQGKGLQAHYAHMVVHGVLHLLGHDHEGDDEARLMEDLERRHLGALGFADPYAGESDE